MYCTYWLSVIGNYSAPLRGRRTMHVRASTTRLRVPCVWLSLTHSLSHSWCGNCIWHDMCSMLFFCVCFFSSSHVTSILQDECCASLYSVELCAFVTHASEWTQNNVFVARNDWMICERRAPIYQFRHSRNGCVCLSGGIDIGSYDLFALAAHQSIHSQIRWVLFSTEIMVWWMPRWN